MAWRCRVAERHVSPSELFPDRGRYGFGYRESTARGLKCAVALNSLVAVPVHTMTVAHGRGRPSVTISTCLAPARTFETRDRSKKVPPRDLAAAARPRHARCGSSVNVAPTRIARAHRALSPCARSPAAPTAPRVRLPARLAIHAATLFRRCVMRPRCSRRPPATLDPEPPQESRRIERRTPPAFRDAARRAKTVSLADVSEGGARFGQEHARVAASASCRGDRLRSGSA